LASSDNILWLLADVFQSIVDSSHPQYHSAHYREGLANLECELESRFNGKHAVDRMDLSDLSSTKHREFAVMEICRLAALIYLERASRNFSGHSTKLESWANAGFAILAAMSECKYNFPIFIIACEARRDEQRIIILDCLERTLAKSPSAGGVMVREMIQSAWAMDDLETAGEVDYMAKMDLIISGWDTMPSFA
jgi:hypothetical protein